MTATMTWVVLTLGDRPAELRRAVDSIRAQSADVGIVVVENGGAPVAERADVVIVRSPTNLGIPGGRDLGLRSTDAEIVGFLDDDAALLSTTTSAAIIEAFERDATLGAVSLRLVDEHGGTARRHVPRPASGDPSRGGHVTTFLGGASAIRRSAYDAAGGYWPALRYAHEELELSWRLIDRGTTVRYLADQLVEHPRTDVGRHPEGWWYTARNRVMIARRNLPWPIAAVHVVVWLAVGGYRANREGAGRAYVRGWSDGWRQDVERRPISWRTVGRLTRWGRPPIV